MPSNSLVMSLESPAVQSSSAVFGWLDLRVQASCSVACFPGWVCLTFPLGQTLVVHFCCSDTEGVSCRNATCHVILHWCCLSLMASSPVLSCPPAPGTGLACGIWGKVADSVGGKLIRRGTIGSGLCLERLFGKPRGE